MTLDPRIERRYTVKEIAAILHRAPKTVRALLKPHRAKCALAREGRHPRLILYVPESVVLLLESEVFPAR